MLFTTRDITGLWDVMLPGMSAAGQKTNVIIVVIHMLEVHSKTEIFSGLSWVKS